MEEKSAITDLTWGDIAILRMALKDSVELAKRTHEKFVSEKRPKKMIKQAKWNIEHAENKIQYFEEKIQYSQVEWILNYFRIYGDKDTYEHLKYTFGKVKWY